MEYWNKERCLLIDLNGLCSFPHSSGGQLPEIAVMYDPYFEP
jgi:hypothetical protein